MNMDTNPNDSYSSIPVPGRPHDVSGGPAAVARAVDSDGLAAAVPAAAAVPEPDVLDLIEEAAAQVSDAEIEDRLGRALRRAGYRHVPRAAGPGAAPAGEGGAGDGSCAAAAGKGTADDTPEEVIAFLEVLGRLAAGAGPGQCGTENIWDQAGAAQYELCAARVRARQITAQAQKEAGRITGAAREEADRITAVAREEADQALSQAARIVGEARLQAARIVAEASQEAERARRAREMTALGYPAPRLAAAARGGAGYAGEFVRAAKVLAAQHWMALVDGEAPGMVVFSFRDCPDRDDEGASGVPGRALAVSDWRSRSVSIVSLARYFAGAGPVLPAERLAIEASAEFRADDCGGWVASEVPGRALAAGDYWRPGSAGGDLVVYADLAQPVPFEERTFRVIDLRQVGSDGTRRDPELVARAERAVLGFEAEHLEGGGSGRGGEPEPGQQLACARLSPRE